MSSANKNVEYNESICEKNSSFVHIVEVYRDKTATTLKANATVANPVHVIFFNFMKEFCRCLSDHGHTLAGLLPVTIFSIVQDKEEVYTESKRYPISIVDVVLLSRAALKGKQE